MRVKGMLKSSGCRKGSRTRIATGVVCLALYALAPGTQAADHARVPPPLPRTLPASPGASAPDARTAVSPDAARLAGVAGAADSAAAASTPNLVPGSQAQTCLVEPFQVSEIGSPAPGVVETIAVHRGDVVEQGQVLATLNAQVDEATLALRRAEAAFMSRVTNRNIELYKRKLLPEGDYDELQSRARQAHLNVALQQAILAERTITSPYDGVVVERYVGQGDRVNDNTLLKLAQIDPLLVKVVLPEDHYGRISPGDQATVRINPVIHDDALTATVWRVDSVMDAASGTFVVLLEMENPDGRLPAGVRCSVEFQ